MRKQDNSNEGKLVDKGGIETNATLGINMESTDERVDQEWIEARI